MLFIVGKLQQFTTVLVLTSWKFEIPDMETAVKIPYLFSF